MRLLLEIVVGKYKRNANATHPFFSLVVLIFCHVNKFVSKTNINDNSNIDLHSIPFLVFQVVAVLEWTKGQHV